MKMTVEHYEYLKRAIKAKQEYYMEYHKADFLAYLRQGYSDTRVMWDMLRQAGLMTYVCDTLYPYLNDSHITTALVRIRKELNIY